MSWTYHQGIPGTITMEKKRTRSRKTIQMRKNSKKVPPAYKYATLVHTALITHLTASQTNFCHIGSRRLVSFALTNPWHEGKWQRGRKGMHWTRFDTGKNKSMEAHLGSWGFRRWMVPAMHWECKIDQECTIWRLSSVWARGGQLFSGYGRQRVNGMREERSMGKLKRGQDCMDQGSDPSAGCPFFPSTSWADAYSLSPRNWCSFPFTSHLPLYSRFKD